MSGVARALPKDLAALARALPAMCAALDAWRDNGSQPDHFKHMRSMSLALADEHGLPEDLVLSAALYQLHAEAVHVAAEVAAERWLTLLILVVPPLAQRTGFVAAALLAGARQGWLAGAAWDAVHQQFEVLAEFGGLDQSWRSLLCDIERHTVVPQ